ncbi:MAG: T9SS type A sorting domain-containing protein [Siphonobacter aquaeclarae]|nr:T9SS type A sorting domain-containing protein [Siphonobacter aquaeclarae]
MKQFLMLIACCMPGLLRAQNVWYFGPSGGSSASGVTTANQVVTFTNSGTGALAPLTATFSISNQQFASIDGNPGVPGMTFGGGRVTGVNSPPASLPLYPAINYLGSSSNPNYTACHTCISGTGINVTYNKGVELFLASDALLNSDGTSAYPVNSTARFADLTITFNRPVSYPVVHLTGLGGDFYYAVNGTGGPANTRNYAMGFSMEAELLTPGTTLTRLSGNTYFALDPTNTRVRNTATSLGAATSGQTVVGVLRYAASGSVVVNATNISSVSFRIYLKGDGGTIRDGNGNVATALNGNAIQWSDQVNHIPAGSSMPILSVSGDAFLVGVSVASPVNVSGNVFNDPDAGNVNNSSGAPNVVPGDMFISLVDANGIVIATTPVNTDGTYTFSNVIEGTYQTVVSTTNYPAGTDLSSTNGTTSTGWQITGDFNGTPNTGNDGTDGKSTPFTVATTDVTNINFGIKTSSSLPVRLVNFSGRWSGEDLAELSWKTTSEVNFSHFEVQHSLDAHRFESAGNVLPDPNGVYQFTSPAAGTGVHYFRLKMVDLDGSADYSNVVSLLNDRLVSINPNPFASELTIRGLAEGSRVLLASMTGKTVLSKSIGAGETKLPVGYLPAGLYILTVTDPNTGFTVRRKLQKL